MSSFFTSLDPYVIGLTILVIAQWAIQALRDRKITPQEWSSLIDNVAQQVAASSSPTETPPPSKTQSSKSYKGKKHK